MSNLKDLKDLEIDTELLTDILTGLIAALILAFIIKNEFYHWFVDNLIGYAVAIMLIVPIARALMTWKMPKELATLLIVGVFFLFIEYYILGQTIYEMLITILETIVLIAIVKAAVRYVKSELYDSLP